MITVEQRRQAWDDVRRFWSYPNLEEPEFTDEGEMKSQIAAIDMGSRRIKVNEKNLEARVGNDLLEPIESHEVGHHKLCPYTLKNLVGLIGQANSIVDSIEKAKMVENLFCDLIVNTHIYYSGDRRIATVYERLSRSNGSSTWWDMYIEVFANMIGKKTRSPSLSQQQRAEASRAANIIRTNMYAANRWGGAIIEFAKLMKPYLPDDKQLQDAIASMMKGLNGLPVIGYHSASDFLPFGPAQAGDEKARKWIEGQLKGVGKRLGQKDFKALVAGTGLGDPVIANIWYYREMVRQYTLTMPNLPAAGGRGHIESPQKCPRERFNEADLNYSFSQNPLPLVFGLYKWKMAKKRGAADGISKPDLFMILDSSGSMPNPQETLSYPVMSAMIAEDTALSHDCKVAGLNYSSGFRLQGFTKSRDAVDEVMSMHLNGGTEIPGQAIFETVKKHAHPTHILIISDCEIGNLDTEKKYLEAALQIGKGGGTVFLHADHRSQGKILEQVGYDVTVVMKREDLVGLTMRKMAARYAA